MLDLACEILIKVVTIELEEIRLCMYRTKSFHVNACFMQMPCMCYPFPITNACEALHTCHGMYCINVYVFSCIASPVM
jgi:hypothetical protein